MTLTTSNRSELHYFHHDLIAVFISFPNNHYVLRLVNILFARTALSPYPLLSACQQTLQETNDMPVIMIRLMSSMRLSPES